MPRTSILLLLAVVAACARFPELDDAISTEARQSDYPRLEPVDGLLATASRSTDQDPQAEIKEVQARARLLKARAVILRRTTIIDPDSQAQMKAAFDRLSR